MKCATHHQDATAICAYCGVALCAACPRTAASRTACSESCAQALAKADQAIDTVLRKSTQMAKANSYTYFVVGAFLIGFGIYSRYQYPRLTLSNTLMLLTGVVFLIAGGWYHTAARKDP